MRLGSSAVDWYDCRYVESDEIDVYDCAYVLYKVHNHLSLWAHAGARVTSGKRADEQPKLEIGVMPRGQ